MFFHLFSLLLNNAYILNKKYGKVSLSHEMYLEYIAEYLIKSSTNTATKLPKPIKVLRPTPNLEKQLVERHFPVHFSLEPGYNKSSKPSKLCNVCNFGKKAILHLTGRQVTNPHKFTYYYPECNVACFQLFHVEAKYEKKS